MHHMALGSQFQISYLCYHYGQQAHSAPTQLCFGCLSYCRASAAANLFMCLPLRLLLVAAASAAPADM